MRRGMIRVKLASSSRHLPYFNDDDNDRCMDKCVRDRSAIVGHTAFQPTSVTANK